MTSIGGEGQRIYPSPEDRGVVRLIQDSNENCMVASRQIEEVDPHIVSLTSAEQAPPPQVIPMEKAEVTTGSKLTRHDPQVESLRQERINRDLELAYTAGYKQPAVYPAIAGAAPVQPVLQPEMIVAPQLVAPTPTFEPAPQMVAYSPDVGPMMAEATPTPEVESAAVAAFEATVVQNVPVVPPAQLTTATPGIASVNAQPQPTFFRPPERTNSIWN